MMGLCTAARSTFLLSALFFGKGVTKDSIPIYMFAGKKRYKIWVMVSLKSAHLKPWKCCFLTNTNLQHEIDFVDLAI